jgi:hypothetical protein
MDVTVSWSAWSHYLLLRFRALWETGDNPRSVVGRAESEDFVVLGSEAGQGLAPKIGEILDCRISLDNTDFELANLGLEAFDLRCFRIRGFSGLLHLLESMLELSA